MRKSTRIKQKQEEVEVSPTKKRIWTRTRNNQAIVLSSCSSSSSSSSSSGSDSESDTEIQQNNKYINDENVNVLNMNNKTNDNTKKHIAKTSLTSSSSSSSNNNKNNNTTITTTKRRSKETKLKVNISPPKQQKCTPSRLESLEKLHINESQQHEKATTNQSIEPIQIFTNSYQNARRVLNSAETKNLPGREQQLQELREFLDEHLQQQLSGSLYISGPPGTGKTACLTFLLKEPMYVEHLQCIYINCTSIASVGSIYKKIFNELKLKLKPQQRPNERSYLAAIQCHLEKSKRMLLLVLDEIDQLCSQRQEVLYTIFEWPAISSARLMLIGIANSLDLTDRALVRLKAHCKLQPKLMHFPPYTKAQIVHIFQARLAEVNVLHMFPASTLNLLAAKVSALSGDVRRALDIGRCVIGLAEEQSKLHNGNQKINMDDIEKCLSRDKPTEGVEERAENEFKAVQVSQVATVLKNVYGAAQALQEDIEDAFPLQQKLMLCSLMLIIRHEKHKDISMNHLHEVYRRVCNKRNIIALDQTEFFSLVDLVDTRGIIRVMRKKEPRLSRVRLQWDEEEVNAALCDKQLIAAILNDRSCLNRPN